MSWKICNILDTSSICQLITMCSLLSTCILLCNLKKNIYALIDYGVALDNNFFLLFDFKTMTANFKFIIFKKSNRVQIFIISMKI